MRLFVCAVFSSGPASSADAVMGSASGEEGFCPMTRAGEDWDSHKELLSPYLGAELVDPFFFQSMSYQVY